MGRNYVSIKDEWIYWYMVFLGVLGYRIVFIYLELGGKLLRMVLGRNISFLVKILELVFFL